ncbi:hypothetical protein LINPERPRIM_LOCUS31543, partial [Linum perenne]
MPKCFLNQLKETITEGPVPSAALFAKVSGLVHEKENSDLGAESQRGVSKEGPDDSSLLSKDAGDWSGSNLCVICGKNGQLLVCGTDGCSSVVHESCLGSTPSFDWKIMLVCY